MSNPTDSGASPAPAIRVPADFESEFEDASALATECFMNFGVVAGSVQAALGALLERHGVPSLGAFNVLTIVEGADGPVAPSVVAARMVVSRPTVTGLLDTLERRGLVERRAHRADGRMRTVVLTQKGRRLVRRLLPVVHRFERDVIGGLDRSQQESLLAILGSLQYHLPTVLGDVPLGIRD